MRASSFNDRMPRRQSGAALVVGLLLLLVLTVLAISGANTSSLSLIVAGNVQYSQNAFQAAETGIEKSIVLNKFNPADEEEQRGTVGEDNSTFVAMTRPQLDGASQPALPGSSLDDYSTYHFEIESTGESQRGATATNVQAVGVIAPADTTIPPLPGAPGEGEEGEGPDTELR